MSRRHHYLATVRLHHLILMLTSFALFAVAGCGGAETTAPVLEPTSPQIGVPTSAGETSTPSELGPGEELAISPSGDARVAFDGEQWCHELDATVTCLEAAAADSGSTALSWRRDELAIAVTDVGAGNISIIDFGAGTVVETTIDDHRVYDWLPDRDLLLGAVLVTADELSTLDPTDGLAADRVAEREIPSIPQIVWPAPDRLWAAETGTPVLHHVDPDSGRWTAIDGGLGEQRITDASLDGTLVVTLDDDVTRGVGDPATDASLWLFDADLGRSAGVLLPDAGEARWAQLDAAGDVLLVLWSPAEARNEHRLGAAPIDRESLTVGPVTELVVWPADDTERPSGFESNGQLRWDGGDTAWVIADSGRFLEIGLSS